MQVRDIMTRSPVTVGPGTSVECAMRTLDDAGIRHLPVVAQGHLVGIVSDRDLIGATGWPRRTSRWGGASAPRETSGRTVRELMHVRPFRIESRDPAARAAAEMGSRRIGCLPVVDGDALVGIVTHADLLAAFEYVVGCAGADTELDPAVSTIMSTQVRQLPPDATLAEAVEICETAELRHLPIVEAEHLVGIVSDRDLRRAIGRQRSGETPLEELMTPLPIYVEPDQRLSLAAWIMLSHRVSCLPVVEGGDLLGIVTSTDLAWHLADVLDKCSSSMP
jgi:CBS domain-containing protein